MFLLFLYNTVIQDPKDTTLITLCTFSPFLTHTHSCARTHTHTHTDDRISVQCGASGQCGVREGTRTSGYSPPHKPILRKSLQ